VLAKMAEAVSRMLQTGLEHGAWIFGDVSSGNLSAGELLVGAIGSVSCPTSPSGCIPSMRVKPPGAIASFHTHPDPSLPFPSSNDSQNAWANKVFGYVVTTELIVAYDRSYHILWTGRRP
jgi:hypothetical protein